MKANIIPFKIATSLRTDDTYKTMAMAESLILLLKTRIFTYMRTLYIFIYIYIYALRATAYL